MVSTLTEETYEELNYLLREMMFDDDKLPRPTRINISSGEDLFNEYGDNLYASVS